MSDSQTAGVLALLRERGKAGITALDALDIVGSLRLSARIYDLKAQGYQIAMTTETTPTGKRIGRYRLVDRLTPTDAARAFAYPDLGTAEMRTGLDPKYGYTQLAHQCPICGTPLGVVTVSAFDPGFGGARCRTCRKDVEVRLDGPRP